VTPKGHLPALFPRPFLLCLSPPRDCWPALPAARQLSTPAPVGSCWPTPLLVAACIAWPAGPPPLLSFGLPGLTCLPSFPLCVSLFLPLSGYPAPFAPSAAGALCWLLFPCLAGRSFELLCPRAGCCWPRVGAPGRFLLVWHSCPSLHNACIMQHHPFFFPILPSQQMSLHRCFCGG
jgi:hypothetical protein